MAPRRSTVPRGSGESVLPLTGVFVAGSQIVSNVPLILLLEPWLRGFANPTLAWTLAAVVHFRVGAPVACVTIAIAVTAVYPTF